MNTKTIDNRLEQLSTTALPNTDRIDAIMDRIKELEPPVNQNSRTTPPQFKSKRYSQWAAILIIAFVLFIPFNGTSFASTVYTWVHETIIQSQNGTLTISDDFPDDLSTIEVHKGQTKDYINQDELLDSMGAFEFQLPLFNDPFVFTSGQEAIYDELNEEKTTIYSLKFAYTKDGFGPTSTEPNMVIQLRFNDYAPSPNEMERSYKISGKGFKSTSIPFLDKEAILISHDSIYTIACPIISKEVNHELSRDIEISITYIHIEGVQLWEEGQRIAEEIYMQYLEKE